MIEKDFFKTCFDIVASLNVENESQAIAKEVILDEIESLQQRIDKVKIEISALMSRYLYEEDFYIEDTDLDKLLQTLDKGSDSNE